MLVSFASRGPTCIVATAAAHPSSNDADGIDNSGPARIIGRTIGVGRLAVAGFLGAMRAHGCLRPRARTRHTTRVVAANDRLGDVVAVAELLRDSKLLYPEEIRRFLTSRNPDLGYARPLVLLGKGQLPRVREAADLLLCRLDGGREPRRLAVPKAGRSATSAPVCASVMRHASQVRRTPMPTFAA